jgi:hypothetical protein
MAGKLCAAVGCNNYQKDEKRLSFFRFPRDRDRYVTHIASYNDTLWSLSFIDFIKIVYLWPAMAAENGLRILRYRISHVW